MIVKNLSKERLTELKQSYLSILVNEGTFAEVMGVDMDEPSFEMLENVDEYISDEFIFEYYKGVDFLEDDFVSC